MKNKKCSCGVAKILHEERDKIIIVTQLQATTSFNYCSFICVFFILIGEKLNGFSLKNRLNLIGQANYRRLRRGSTFPRGQYGITHQFHMSRQA